MVSCGVNDKDPKSYKKKILRVPSKFLKQMGQRDSVLSSINNPKNRFSTPLKASINSTNEFVKAKLKEMEKN
jgi:hypothetical protein